MCIIPVIVALGIIWGLSKLFSTLFSALCKKEDERLKKTDPFHMTFEGAMRWGVEHHYRVWVCMPPNYIDGGFELTCFADPELAKKCCDTINNIDPRHKAYWRDRRLMPHLNYGRKFTDFP